jgi:hypothetical protein
MTLALGHSKTRKISLEDTIPKGHDISKILFENHLLGDPALSLATRYKIT